jgi:hypothetical protein
MSNWGMVMGVMGMEMGGAMGMEAMKGAFLWPTALDWIIFPYLDDNGFLKP